jgi:hypothetical protein
MKKSAMIVAAFVLIPVLAACGSAKPAPTVEAIATPTEVVASPTVSSSATDTPAAVAEEATEVVPEPVAAFPTPNPNPECVPEPIPEDPNIPPVTADDWSKGSDDALVTFVEYGDFQ